MLYTGITNDLQQRLWFHTNENPKSFTKRYKIDRLVYYESFERAGDAIDREKQIKGWRREKKKALVESLNAGWEDFGARLFPK